METDIIDEKWLIDFYFTTLDLIYTNNITANGFTTDELKFITNVRAQDRENVTILELLMMDPIWAPKFLHRQCECCKVKGYRMLRIQSSRSGTMYVCRDCVDKMFVKPFDEPVDNVSL